MIYRAQQERSSIIYSLVIAQSINSNVGRIMKFDETYKISALKAAEFSPKNNISDFENYKKKQFDSINEDLNAAHISENNHSSDCIRYRINYNKQIEIVLNDINNKYQTLLLQELQIKRETIKRYEQELQSMKHLFEITLKEKQIQNDQLQHERQYQIIFTIIRNRPKKSTSQLNSNTLQKEMIDNEIYQLSNGYTQQNYNRFIQMKKQEVNDMKSSLTFGREVIVKHNDVVPERSKSQYSKKNGATVTGIEQH
ncbi:unnamed protein product [Adineta steineri]|uniref:Uncharacterized protein n=1 Tax=Adineta steineri TaxID=433720 RepID=A0A819UWB6_9BILA|nr:unnamed protein product [Adineta steineri]CAF1252227.1 unnamed protein product [Adineta steineri]CAF4089697.1 unnamed protein product [Adineta steineri]CAF4101991.1 unnamed protein product [Adineta steineri]